MVYEISNCLHFVLVKVYQVMNKTVAYEKISVVTVLHCNINIVLQIDKKNSVFCEFIVQTKTYLVIVAQFCQSVSLRLVVN